MSELHTLRRGPIITMIACLSAPELHTFRFAVVLPSAGVNWNLVQLPAIDPEFRRLYVIHELSTTKF